MFRPSPKNTILTIIVFIILGILSSCTKWMPDEYRNRIHFGEKARKRHLNKASKKHSISFKNSDAKYDKITIVQDKHDPLQGSHGYDWTH